MASPITNYIIWIDQDMNGGDIFFSSTVGHFKEQTMFVQLSNNASLANWIDENKQKLELRSSNLVVVTNMRRKEEGVLTELAGVNSVRLIRQKIDREVPIAIFVHQSRLNHYQAVVE